MQINIEESNEAIVARYQAESDKTVKNALIGTLYQRNIGLIKKIASKYAAYVDFDDLVQEGFFGLKIAADMYDADQGIVFSSYATIWLKQSMRRYIENCGSSVRFPVNAQHNIYKLGKIITWYKMEFNREPSDMELCAILGVSKEVLKKLKLDQIKFKIRSLDEPLSGEEDTSYTLGDTIKDSTDQMDDIIEIEYNEKLAMVLWDEVNAILSPQEENIIIKRFKDNMTLDQVGSKMGITAEGVRQHQAHAMRKLRQSKIIKQYREDIISHAYTGTGLRNYLYSGTSATERAAIRLYDSYKPDINEIEKQIEEIDKLLNEG